MDDTCFIQPQHLFMVGAVCTFIGGVLGFFGCIIWDSLSEEDKPWRKWQNSKDGDS